MTLSLQNAEDDPSSVIKRQKTTNIGDVSHVSDSVNQSVRSIP